MQDKNLRSAIIYLALGLVIGYFGRGWLGQGFTDGWQAAEEKLMGLGQSEELHAVVGTVTEIDGQKITMELEPYSPLTELEKVVATVKINNQTVLMARQPLAEEEYFDVELLAQRQEIEQAMIASLSDPDRQTALREQLQDLDWQLEESRSQKIEQLSQAAADLASEDKVQQAELRQQIEALSAGFRYVPVSLEQIQVGQSLSVESQDDIYQDSSFTASRITVN